MNWDKIWDKFNTWYSEFEFDPDWVDQKKKIEELVEEERKKCLLQH